MINQSMENRTAMAKLFKPKNNLPRLESYTVSAGDEFWGKFPVNSTRDGKPLISPAKLRRLADRIGYSGANFETVCNDLEFGADIGCTGPGRGASRSNNAPSVTSFRNKLRIQSLPG